VKKKEVFELGKVTGIEINKKEATEGKVGTDLSVKIEWTQNSDPQRPYGRGFDHTNELISRISRKSIDLLKENFKNEITKDDVQLIQKLKLIFKIQ